MKTEKILKHLIKPLVLSGAYKDETVALKDIVISQIESKLVSRVEIRTHPHHFHARNGKIKESKLKGDVITDIKKVLSAITKVIVKHEC